MSGANRAIQVALIEEEDIVRACLSALIQSWPEMAIVAEGSENDAVSKLTDVAADIVVLSLPGSDEPDKQLAWRIAAAYAPERIVVLASDWTVRLRAELQRAGITQVISKTADPNELHEAIRIVHARSRAEST